MEQRNNYINPLQSREAPAVPVADNFLSEVKWQDAEVDGNWLDPTEAYIPPRYTLSYKGVPFAPLGGLHGLTGQPGHGKTFTFTQIMVAILRGEFYNLHYELSNSIPKPRVLYIDTEMEKGNTQLVMLRVYEMMGWPIGSKQEQFKVLWLREEVKAENRWRKTLKAINVMQPTVVFLDGLLDVVGDFNDNKECQAIIYQCMATASHYGISLWCLLHENPGSEKMVGHVGSFLERKATDLLKVKKDKDAGGVQFSVTQKKARARDLDDWQFIIEDDDHHYGHPIMLACSEPQEFDEQEEVRSMISPIGTRQNVSFTWLRDAMKKNFGVGSSKATELIGKAVKLGYLIVRDNRYTANPPTLFKDDDNEMPL